MLKLNKYYCSLIKYYIYNIINIDKHHQNLHKKIIFVCDGTRNHGGIADRLKGILTTYYFSKQNKIRFYILWKCPFHLSSYLLPNLYDWRINEKKFDHIYRRDFPIILEMSKHKWKNKIKLYLLKKILKKDISYIIYTNLYNQKLPYNILFFELFRPSMFLHRKITFHEKEIGTKYYSYTFRFGNTFNDFKDIVGIPLEPHKKINLLNKCINILKEFIGKQPPDYKALITSDSFFFLKNIKNIDPRIYIVDEIIKHPEFNKNENVKKEIWSKSFLDFYMIMRAEKIYQFKSKEMYNSGFPELAAIIGQKPYLLYRF